MKVSISRPVLDQILAHAAEHPDAEVCGLLLGDAGEIIAACPAANVAPDRSRRFEIDPAVLFEAHRAARDGGPSILGHYHSHPNGNASPSAADAEEAQPGQLWLIVAGTEAVMFGTCRTGPIHGRFQPVDIDLR